MVDFAFGSISPYELSPSALDEALAGGKALEMLEAAAGRSRSTSEIGAQS
jgi:hypothetical protein